MTRASTPDPNGVWLNCQLAPGALALNAEALPDAAIAVQDGRFAWIGLKRDLPPHLTTLPRHDARGAVVTPGLIDCHTHLVYGGNRAAEYALRLTGARYAQIAKAGGGIVSTVRATREADEHLLFTQASKRLDRLLAEGVCAVEIKSGYGLDVSTEHTSELQSPCNLVCRLLL